MLDPQLQQQVERFGQGHLLHFWNELPEDQRSRLAGQIAGLDWDLIQSSLNHSSAKTDAASSEVRRATPPAHVVRIPPQQTRPSDSEQARPLGEAALREGKVGAVLLAGGQGSRLGFKQSKGLFPIGPVSGKTLLELLATQVRFMSEKYGRAIPYFVMTSDGTHQEIESFYQKNGYFGLNPRDVYLFHQGFAPSLDLQTGQVLLADKGSLSLNPDGHGGIFAALWKAGLFETMKSRGIEYLFSHQVDNPLVKVCDPDFVGLHIQYQSEVSTKVVAKTAPEEKVGIAADIDGRTQIIEYIDMPEDMAKSRDQTGGLRFWAGSTAIHLFNRSFVERIATSHSLLPWHRAIKKIPHLNPEGELVTPDKENGVKFERFIFDTLPLAKVALIVETLRDEEFAPLKNKEGEFSPEYVRNKIVQRSVNWLKSKGVTVADGTAVEICPSLAVSSEDLENWPADILSQKFDQPQFLSSTKPTA